MASSGLLSPDKPVQRVQDGLVGTELGNRQALERGIRFLFLIFSGGGRGRNRREIYSQRQARAGENQSKERSGRCGHRREAKTKAGCAEIPRLHGVLLRFLRPTGERRAGLTV